MKKNIHSFMLLNWAQIQLCSTFHFWNSTNLTVASDIGCVVGKDCDVVGDDVIGAVHEAEVGAAVEHVEVDAPAVVEDVRQNIRKL